MRSLLMVLLLVPALARADELPSKMKEEDRLRFQVLELQSQLAEMNKKYLEAAGRALTCETARDEVERNKQRAALASTYKMGEKDGVKLVDGTIVRAPAPAKEPPPAAHKTAKR